MKVIQTMKKNKHLRQIYDDIRTLYYCSLTVLSPELNTKARYKAAFGRKLDLKNPKTLNEKVLWLKLNNYINNPLVSKCADKYKVREYVKECGLEDILVKLYGVYKTADEIPWDSLPNQFVLKWNFGAGYNIVCTNKAKMDKKTVISQMKKWGREKYWLPHSEMQYKKYPKLIICEELLNAKEGNQ